MPKNKKKHQFQISLYILVPFITSGAALLWVLLRPFTKGPYSHPQEGT